MRCFTVLLACGWLLLMAPKKQDGNFDSTKPLRDWEQFQFFDSAAQCNRSYRISLRNYVYEFLKEKGMSSEEAYKKLDDPNLREIRNKLEVATRCIPSDAINFPLK